MANVLFLLRTYNDIDHITPIIWKTLKEGDRAIVIFEAEYDYKNDYRLNFLRTKFELPVFEFPLAYKLSKDNNLFFKIMRTILYNDFLSLNFLKKYKIDSCVFQWSATYGKCLRGYFFSAAKKMGVPTFSVPHGCKIFLNYDVNDYIKSVKEKTGKWPDFSSRSDFDFFVLQSPYHRQLIIDWGQDPDKTFAWGSTRFYPEWVKKNLEICLPFNSSKDSLGRMKVVFMLPHWSYNVDKDKCIELIDELASLPWIYLVIKAHTRKEEGEFSNDLKEKYNSLANVETDTPGHSPALVKWSDAVINFGSSIGIEALIQGKYLINPFYLHSNTTIFDKTKSAYSAGNREEVMDLLQGIRNNTLSQIPEANKKALYREVIYAGKDEYDVLDFYWKKITLKE